MAAGDDTPTGGWADDEQVRWYTARIGTLEARLAGEAVLLDVLAPEPRRVLDLGGGDGRLAGVILDGRPSIEQVVIADRSEPMLRLAAERFAEDDRVEIVAHDLGEPLPFDGTFDVVVSGFAIHHLDDQRKRSLLGDVARVLEPGGVFANLEVVRSATPARHAAFLAAIGRTADDPEDHLAPVEDQLDWMRAAGLVEVDCLWRWRGFALLVGEAPSIGMMPV